jgi:sporulation protein YunB
MSIFSIRAFYKNYSVALNSTLGNECTYIINNAVDQAMRKSGNLTEMLTVEKNETGVISYVYCDHSILNRLSLDTMEVLEDEMIGLKNIRMQIPLGNLLGSGLLSGKGPKLRAEAYPNGGIYIDFQSSLSEAGINQVLFHLDMRVSVEMETVFGLRHFLQRIERAVPVCDIVIVGNVPQTYANLPAETDFLNLVP